MLAGVPPEAALALKRTFLLELEESLRLAREAHAALAGDSSDRQAQRHLRDFFHKLAGTAYAADLAILGQLGAVSERLADLLLAGKLSDPCVAVEAFSEALVGVAAALEEHKPAKLPEAPQPPEAMGRPAATSIPDDQSLSKVLVIDDDPFSARLVDTTLRGAGFQSACCCNPERALATIAAEAPDLIVLDVVMPGISGFDVCRSVRSNPAMQLTPIIFVTRRGDVDQRVAGLEAGGNDYLAKPFEPQELVARVRSHLHRQAVLRDMAIRDGLTRCFNHKYLKMRLEQELARAKRYKAGFAVAMIDVDHFKNVNDTHGHAAGDTVLANLASLVMASVRTTDVVARYGGEEFALLLIEASAKEACVISDRLRERVARNPVVHCDAHGATRQIPVTVSIGVTDLQPNDTIQTLIERSDAALYEAKKGGRNQVRTSL